MVLRRKTEMSNRIRPVKYLDIVDHTQKTQPKKVVRVTKVQVKHRRPP